MKSRFCKYTWMSLFYFILHPSAFILMQRQRIILHVPQRAHMFDALADKLDMPDVHRATGVHPFFMRHAHDAKPIVAAALADADLFAHARREDFSAAARDRR